MPSGFQSVAWWAVGTFLGMSPCANQSANDSNIILLRRLEPPQSRPEPLAATHAAFARAYGASLGSICVATLVLTVTQSSIFVLRTLRRISTPPQLAFLAPLHPLELVSGLIGIFESLSSHTLTYIGLTGEGFWPGSRRAKELLSGNGKGGRAKGSRSGDCE